MPAIFLTCLFFFFFFLCFLFLLLFFFFCFLISRYAWAPQGLSPAEVEEYFALLPPEAAPLIGSEGEIWRAQQLYRQMPPWDTEPTLCDSLVGCLCRFGFFFFFFDFFFFFFLIWHGRRQMSWQPSRRWTTFASGRCWTLAKWSAAQTLPSPNHVPVFQQRKRRRKRKWKSRTRKTKKKRTRKREGD